jgi:hypothetical protein
MPVVKTLIQKNRRYIFWITVLKKYHELENRSIHSNFVINNLLTEGI